MSEVTTTLFAPSALLPTGWAADVRLEVSADGWLVGVQAGADPGAARRLPGPALPGMPNLHSHAFQRAMAGHAESATADADSFWTWRAAMYRLVDRLDPDTLQAVTAWLYAECLEAGYTSVAEFHYVHHDRDGAPFADPAELSGRVLEAARAAGIGLTLLPVLYMKGGIDQPPTAAQRRFVHPPDGILRLVEALLPRLGPGQRVGLAPHSLRAVPLARLPELVAGLDGLAPGAPVHIHVAEQTAEVDAVVAAHGLRPVQALADRVGLDARWCLVHATHIDPSELRALRDSGAVAGLCPTTEANLGDGLFPAEAHVAGRGRLGVGSDSQVSRDPFAELRLLELGQRLVHQRRAVLRPPGERHTGAALWRLACAGGAVALGQRVGALAVGCRADLVCLDPAHPGLAATAGDPMLDAAVFAAGPGAVDEVWVGGRRVVARGRHVERPRLQAAFVRAMATLHA